MFANVTLESFKNRHCVWLEAAFIFHAFACRIKQLKPANGKDACVKLDDQVLDDSDHVFSLLVTRDGASL